MSSMKSLADRFRTWYEYDHQIPGSKRLVVAAYAS